MVSSHRKETRRNRRGNPSTHSSVRPHPACSAPSWPRTERSGDKKRPPKRWDTHGSTGDASPRWTTQWAICFASDSRVPDPRARFLSAGALWAAAVDSGERLFEPGLPAALSQLSEQQRVAVVLVHGYAWTLREVSELVEVSVSTIQTHLERGMAKLRAALEEVDDA